GPAAAAGTRPQLGIDLAAAAPATVGHLPATGRPLCRTTTARWRWSDQPAAGVVCAAVETVHDRVHCLQRPDWPGQSDDGCRTTQLPNQQGLPSETFPTATDSAAAGPTAAATVTDATAATTAVLADIEHSDQFAATAASSGQHAPCSR